MFASFKSMPFVVSVSLKILPVSFSRFLICSVTFLIVFMLRSGSPPKKSISQCLRGPEPSMRKSTARHPTSGDMTARSMP